MVQAAADLSVQEDGGAEFLATSQTMDNWLATG